MKKILIDDDLTDLAKEYKSLLDVNSDNPKPLERLEALKVNLENLDKKYEEYIDEVIDCYKDHNLIELLPSKFDKIYEDHFSRFHEDDNFSLSRKFTKIKDEEEKKCTQPFYMHIVNALGYDRVRSNIFPQFMLRLGIRSCVYCNSTFAVATSKSNSSYRLTYSLDHYMPKNKYPFLAVSFFNLYPCCQPCNSTKSTKSPYWRLYTENPNEGLNPFRFRFKSGTLMKYEISWDNDDLEIEFTNKDGTHDVGAAKKYDDYFHTESLYNNFKPEIEEVLWKRKIYNSTMLDILRTTLPKEINADDYVRLIIGNYTSEKDILRRPLAKLMQDLAKEIF